MPKKTPTTSRRTAPFRPKKTPIQRRARATFDAILDATARILVTRGFAGATTNHVAAKAGVSIGTLYEWFPGKDALVAALAERHLDRADALLEARVAALAGAAASMPLAELARLFAETMVELHEDDPRLHRVLFEEVPHGAPVRARVRRTEERMTTALAGLLAAHPEVRARDPELAAHLVIQVLEATTHRWATDRAGAPIGRERLVEELATLLVGYLGAR